MLQQQNASGAINWVKIRSVYKQNLSPPPNHFLITRIVFKRSSRDLVKLLWISNKHQITWAFVCWSRSIELMLMCITLSDWRQKKNDQMHTEKFAYGKMSNALGPLIRWLLHYLDRNPLWKRKEKKTGRFCPTPCSLLTLQVFVTRNQSLLLLKGWRLAARSKENNYTAPQVLSSFSLWLTGELPLCRLSLAVPVLLGFHVYKSLCEIRFYYAALKTTVVSPSLPFVKRDFF